MRQKPYKLPEKTIVSAGAEINIDLVRELIKKHEVNSKRYEYLENLYKGFHDIYNRPEKEAWKPDNRLAVNFPRYITDTFLGFTRGIPIKKNHDDKTFKQTLDEFDKLNDMDDHDYELCKMACMYGHAYEYVYQNEDTETRVARVSPKQCFIVYDDTIRGMAMFAVRYGYDDSQRLTGEVITTKQIYRISGNTLVEDSINPYGRLPVTEFYINEERISLFEGVSGKTEAYNKAIGEKANDIDAFAEAYLAILGAELDEEQVYRIRDDRIINIYGTDDAKDIVAQFLTKPTADGSQENLLDRLEKLIYQLSMVANVSDENFGNASGTALAYRLHAMGNLGLTFNRKTQASMRRRYRLFCSLSTNTPNKDAYEGIEYVFTQNMPRNLLEEAQTASQLTGVTSKRTQLSALSIVKDADTEMEQIEKEQEDMAGGSFNRLGVVDNGEDEQ